MLWAGLGQFSGAGVGFVPLFILQFVTLSTVPGVKCITIFFLLLLLNYFAAGMIWNWCSLSLSHNVG
jgi:hypothetical protein